MDSKGRLLSPAHCRSALQTTSSVEMHPSALLGLSSLALASLIRSPPKPSPARPHAVPATWDGKCWYPTADSGFQLESYLSGRWYQVAGTLAPFTAGCRCISAQYTLNVREPGVDGVS